MKRIFLPHYFIFYDNNFHFSLKSSFVAEKHYLADRQMRAHVCVILTFLNHRLIQDARSVGVFNSLFENK